MIRRFVNVVAENYKSGMYSLHRLDISKHLFHPSTTEALAAAAGAEEEDKKNVSPPQIPILPRLPAPCMNLQPCPTTLAPLANLEFFASVSPRSSESRVLCSNIAGHCLLYDADSHSVLTMPSLQGPNVCSPITVSIRRPRDLEEELYALHHVGGQGANVSCFEVLRFGSQDRSVHRPGGRRGWHWESLPLAPFEGIIFSHTVVDGGRTICVSSSPDDFGTYCFDVVERDWWKAGDWVLPFLRGAEYVPELKIWLGFSTTWPHHLCTTSDLEAMDRPPTVQHILPDLKTPERWTVIKSKLLNLGDGRFCVAKHFGVLRDTGEEPDYYSDLDIVGPEFLVLTGVELVSSGRASEEGEPEGLKIVTHKSERFIFNEYGIKWVL